LLTISAVSDNWLIIVPLDPFAAPEARAVEAARQVVEDGLPDAHEVTVEVATHPQFIDAGANFERVNCPSCGADLGDWWALTMEYAHERDFGDLSLVTPCCRTRTTLNDLNYDWPQAFARLSIHAMNPNVRELPPAVKDDVERRLGTPTRIIWQHI
jgi:hypothetical protein